jgi:hypothetical protein
MLGEASMLPQIRKHLNSYPPQLMFNPARLKAGSPGKRKPPKAKR